MASGKALGRGFEALISPGKKFNSGSEDGKETEISVDLIRINKEQPRKTFDEEKLRELAQSIRNHGIIQPIIVRRIEDRNHFEVVAGERRFRASILAELKKIPVLIREISEGDLPVISLLENIQREDLTPIEEAEACAKLMQLKNYTQEVLAEKLGKSRSNLANTLRLLQLPEEVRKALNEGSITPGHGRAILTVENPEKQLELKEQIVREKLSVREAENLGKQEKKSSKTKPKTPEKNLHLNYAQERLGESLAAKVKITGNATSGKIEIFYTSDEDFNRIYDLLHTKKL